MPPQAPSTADVTSSTPAGAGEAPAEAAGDPVGVVFGDVDARRFRFAVRETGLGQGSWVAVHHPERDLVLARVESVRRETDLSAREARDLEEPGAGAGDDQVTAEAQVVGSASGSGEPPSTPVPAGAAVREAPADLVATALGLPDPDGPRPRGAYLGKVRGRDVDVVLDVEDLVRRHVSVLAKTGAGKSYLVGVLLEELAKEGVPAVVVDPHGEHDGLARPNRDEEAFPRMRSFGVEPRQYADALAKFHPDPAAEPDAEPLRLDDRNLPLDELEQLVGDLTNAQQGLLHEALRGLRDRPAHYTLEDVAKRVREAESSAKWNLLSNLESLTDRPLFQGEPTDPGHLVARGQVSLVNLRGVEPTSAEIAVARLANTLFEARKRGEIPPFLLVVEEAHRFCPERGYDTSVAGPALRTVASEGRKFGMGCAIVSQRPAKVDKNVLSQCNTEIAMKVTNPRDVKALASSLEGLTDGMADEIKRLPVGQAVVSHPDLRTPAVTEVRPRETRPGGDRTPVVADAPAEAAADAPAPDPDAFPGDGARDPAGTQEQARVEAQGAVRERDDPAGTDPPDPPEPPAPPEPGEGPAVDGTPNDPRPDEGAPDPEEEPEDGADPSEPGTAPSEPGPEPRDDPGETADPDDHAPDDPAPEAVPREADVETSPADEAGPDPDEGGEAVDAVLRPAEGTQADGDAPEAGDEDLPSEDAEAGTDEVLEETAEADQDPAEADLDAGPADAAGEPARTVAAVEEAHGIVADVEPREMDLDRLRALVGEVEDLLTRLGRVGDRSPEVVEAHNRLASELVRLRRGLAAREARRPERGLLRR